MNSPAKTTARMRRGTKVAMILERPFADGRNVAAGGAVMLMRT
jgi:hypothetical protein